MQTFDAICQRASTREYQDKPIEKELLMQLVDAGRRAPSARHVEPWDFIVIADKDVLGRIAEKAANGRFVQNAAACIAVFCQETKYYLEDGCAATQNILLQAADAGLGACWIAGDKKDYAQDIRDMLGVPSGYNLVSLIALGWPRQAVRQKKGRGLDEVLHWERFERASHG